MEENKRNGREIERQQYAKSTRGNRRESERELERDIKTKGGSIYK